MKVSEMEFPLPLLQDYEYTLQPTFKCYLYDYEESSTVIKYNENKSKVLLLLPASGTLWVPIDKVRIDLLDEATAWKFVVHSSKFRYGPSHLRDRIINGHSSPEIISLLLQQYSIATFPPLKQ